MWALVKFFLELLGLGLIDEIVEDIARWLTRRPESVHTY